MWAKDNLKKHNKWSEEEEVYWRENIIFKHEAPVVDDDDTVNTYDEDLEDILEDIIIDESENNDLEITSDLLYGKPPNTTNDSDDEVKSQHSTNKIIYTTNTNTNKVSITPQEVKSNFDDQKQYEIKDIDSCIVDLIDILEDFNNPFLSHVNKIFDIVKPNIDYDTILMIRQLTKDLKIKISNFQSTNDSLSGYQYQTLMMYVNDLLRIIKQIKIRMFKCLND
jgi:hypothetical protein